MNGMNGYEFQLGAEVHGRDKSFGHLRKIGIEPNNWQVTHLIVERGLLFRHTKVIPAKHTQHTDADGIHLSIDAEQWDGFDDYEETTVTKHVEPVAGTTADQIPVSQGVATMGSAELPHVAPYTPHTDLPEMRTVQEKVHLGISEEDIVLDEDTVVAGEDKEFGRLTGITAEADSFYLSTVITAQGQLIARPFQIAATSVKSLSDERIQVSLTGGQVAALLEDTDVWDDDDPHVLDRPL